MKTKKIPLDLEVYQDYQIDQKYSAYELTAQDITEQQAEDLEFYYTSKGHRIFHSELIRQSSGLFNLKLIMAKLDVLF